MSGIRITILVVLIVAIIILFGSIFTITEGQQGLLLRLGKLQKDSKTHQVEVFNPGLHFKVPLIETARRFDTRLQTLTIQSSRIITAEKKYVLVDYYVKWRIRDLPLYYTRTGGNEQQAANLLQQQLNDSLRAEFGRRTIQEVVSDDRTEIMAALLKQADLSAEKLGISVVDVRIKQIDLPSQVRSAVFNRMRAERERVATENRSEGKATAEAIRANADANVTVTIAKAKANAAKIRAEGEAKAAAIYAEAFNKDPKFYAFYRSLNAYQNAFNNKNDILVLRPDSQFFEYFDKDVNANSVKKPVASNNSKS